MSKKSSASNRTNTARRVVNANTNTTTTTTTNNTSYSKNGDRNSSSSSSSSSSMSSIENDMLKIKYKEAQMNRVSFQKIGKKMKRVITRYMSIDAGCIHYYDKLTSKKPRGKYIFGPGMRLTILESDEIDSEAEDQACLRVQGLRRENGKERDPIVIFLSTIQEAELWKGALEYAKRLGTRREEVESDDDSGEKNEESNNEEEKKEKAKAMSVKERVKQKMKERRDETKTEIIELSNDDNVDTKEEDPHEETLAMKKQKLFKLPTSAHFYHKVVLQTAKYLKLLSENLPSIMFHPPYNNRRGGGGRVDRDNISAEKRRAILERFVGEVCCFKCFFVAILY
jgi:hypothetical protein